MSLKSNEIQTTVNCTAVSSPESTQCATKDKKKSFLMSLPERIPAFGIICEVNFSLGAIIVKVMTEMHSIEVMVFRCIIQFFPFLFIIWKQKYPLFGEPGHRIDLCLRCIFGTIALICAYMAYRMMALSDASTIFMSSPIFTAIFAYIFLKDPITLIHGLTGLVTVVGVVIVSRPDFIFGESDNIYEQRVLGIILAVVSTAGASFVMINLRNLKATPAPVIVMWYSLTCIISGSILLPILDKWVMPSNIYSWLMLIGIGFTGIFHQYLLTTALKYESPGPISVARSFNVVLAFIWEITIFAEPIEWTSIVGAALVTCCVFVTGLTKYYNDDPVQFKNKFGKFFCCLNHKQIEKNLDRVSDSTETSIESIDQDTPVLKI